MKTSKLQDNTGFPSPISKAKQHLLDIYAVYICRMMKQSPITVLVTVIFFNKEWYTYKLFHLAFNEVVLFRGFP